MTYKAILVHVSLGDDQMQVDLAAHLAKEFGAHLTGVCSLPEVAILRGASHNAFVRLGAGKTDELIKQEYDAAKEAERTFDAIANKEGVTHSWVTGEGEPAEIIIHAARLQDLAVVEQTDQASDLLWGPAVQVALSGHPALIVPRSWTSTDFGRHALIAWNGSAQAAAAVRKALPLLAHAKQVTVLVGDPRGAFPAAMRMTPLDLPAYLRHQGIAAETENIDRSDADAGEAIMDYATAHGVDLIVMGAFGRSRFREWILGGATRHVLEHMTAPVFMAHQ